MRGRLIDGARRNALAVALGLAAALPVIVATIRDVAAGWLPLADDGIIAVRSFDVLSTHPPLLGQYSASSQLIGKAVLSPGPMLYWLLALPVRIGEATPTIAIGLVNTAAIVGIAVLARRRGGVVLMVAAAAWTALACRSIDAGFLHDVWNPAAAVLPFALLIFVAWSVACGEYRLLPLMALVASFVTQAQLTYVLPAVALVAVAVAFLVTSDARVPRRWVIATLAVVVVCWSLPLADEVVHRPGNVERIVQAATADTPRLGVSAGLRAVAHAVGVAPWWLRAPRTPLDRVGDVGSGPGALTAVTAVVVILGLAGVAAVAFRRERRDVAAAAVLALAMLPPLGAVAASTPTSGILFATVGYTLWWASPAGMFAWLVLAFGTAALAGRARVFETSGRLAVALGACVAVAAGTYVAARGKHDRLFHAYGTAQTLVDRLGTLAPRDRTTLVQGSKTSVAFALQGAAIYALRRDGRSFVCSQLPGIGTRYDPARKPHQGVLDVLDDPRAGALPGRLVLRTVIRNVPADVPPLARRARPVAVTLSP